MGNNNEAEIWNLHNRLIHCINQKNVNEIMKVNASEDVKIELPDQSLELCGLSEIGRYLTRWEQDSSSYQIHLVNSPSIRVTEDHAETSCMTASFEWNTVESEPIITHFASRLDAAYSYREQKWEITKLCWYDYAALEPWAIDTQEISSLPDQIQTAYVETIPEQMPAGSEAYTTVANCVGKRMYQRICREQDFIMLCTPVITGNDQRAEGYWNGLRFVPRENDALAMSIILMHECFENREEQWYSTESEMKCLAEFPVMELTPFAPPPAKLMAEANRRQDVPEGQPGRPDLKEYFSIINTAALWTSAIRTCSPGKFFEECLAKDHPNLYVNVVKRTEGLDGFFKECGMMVHMDQTQAKKPGNHTLSTPWITISEDGKTAMAAFLDFGWTMMAEGFGNHEAPYPALPNIGRYVHYLIKENGRWKVWGFNWGPLYQNGAWSYDPKTTRGWSKTRSKYRWPEVLETYHYQEEFDGVDEFLTNSILPYMKTDGTNEKRRMG